MTRISDYIELDRKFVAFDEDSQAEEREDLLFARPALSGTEKFWADILHNQRTVVLAEARAGKTTELRAQTKKLRSEGKAAFFCQLEILAGGSLEDSLGIGTRQQFRAWVESDAPGYFFLDAVDEARLASWINFEKAVRHFREAVESHLARLTVVISTRPNVWQFQADRDMLTRLLDFPQEIQIVRNDTNASDFNRDGRSPVPENETTRTVRMEKRPPIAVMQMASLSRSQVRIFAEAKGVANIDAFIEAIESVDADIFATRPEDLLGLIAHWKDSDSLGSYTEVVARDITLKLAEKNPKDSAQAPISAARAYEGATMLAVAVTLTKRSSILLSDDPVDEMLHSKCVDPEQVLSDWTPGEIQALLGRGMFDPALYGSVRFYHRTAREYLAARWFEKLLLEQTNRRSIERLLFVRPYGILSEVVVPAFKPIVGWLAAWDERIRNRAVRIDPKLLLEYGDPSTLDIGIRATLLQDFACRYKNRQHTPLGLYSRREARRVADHRLAGVIRKLLGTYRDHTAVRRLLLRIIREGRIPECGQLACTFATNTEMDAYTRSIAVRAVGSAGTLSEQKRLAEEILAQASGLDHNIVSAAIDSLWPDALTDQGVLVLLEEVLVPGQFGAPDLEYVILPIPSRISDRDRVYDFLTAILELLSRPPLHDNKFCRVSIKFSWLLNLLWVLVGRLRSLHGAPETVPEFLEAITLCSQSRSSYVLPYRGRMDEEIAQLLHGDAKIRHALFWHQYAQVRKLEAEPVTNFQFIHRFENGNVLDARDSDYYLRDIRERADLEDKRVAMLVLFDVCNARENVVLERIRDVVNGNSDLEAELDRLLIPPAPSEAYLEEQRKRSEREEQRRQQEIGNARARQDWIEKLKADPRMVGDLSLAEEGRIWHNTDWLLREIQEKTHAGNRLTASDWELLIPDFGETVAQQCRDFCRSFWRRYTPPLRPENAEGSRPIPDALIVGLSGLAMEASGDETWAERLTDDEAEIATRYALWESNDFPDWFPALLRAKPEPVRQRLRKEIEWECSAFPPDGLLLYVLEKLRTTRVPMGNNLRGDIVDILETKEEVAINPLKSALAIILKNDTPLPDSFQDTAARQAEAVSSEQQKALWLAALFCLDAKHALDIMEPWANSSSKQDGEKRVSLVISHLWGHVWGVDATSFKTKYCDYMQPGLLIRLLAIVHSHVRSDEDIQHDEVYTPDLRDKAQEARDHLLQLLSGIPGRLTYDALIRFSRSQGFAHVKDYLLNLAERRAEDDADFQEWSESQVAEWTRNAERSPETQKELFEIALSRLDDIKLNLEEGDDSEARLWRRAGDEIELRLAIANRLKLISRNRYTTGSEEELADKSRTDIRLHNPKVDARIPIEIKIAGKWSANKLRERMETQLVGQYLREARFGIFMLVNRRAGSDRRSWRPGDKNLDFSALVQWLKGESGSVLQANPRLQKIEVLGIDLTKRIAAGRRCFTEAYETFAREADLSALALDPDEVFGTVRDTIPGRDVEL